jgi:predicted RNA-binding protein with PUA-like domain
VGATVTTQYWLMKSDAYFIDHLARDRKTCWDGVRNYQARNFMRDQMKIGDPVLFYHSNADPSGVAGVARVCSKAYPEKDPPWMMVDVEFVEKFPHFVSLNEIRREPRLGSMLVLKRAQRLSIQPVEKGHFEIIKKMGTRCDS